MSQNAVLCGNALREQISTFYHINYKSPSENRALQVRRDEIKIYYE